MMWILKEIEQRGVREEVEGLIKGTERWKEIKGGKSRGLKDKEIQDNIKRCQGGRGRRTGEEGLEI